MPTNDEDLPDGDFAADEAREEAIAFLREPVCGKCNEPDFEARINSLSADHTARR
jgi:hypothetical protein